VYVIDARDGDWRAVTATAGSARFDELPAGKTVVHVEVKGRKALDKTVSLVAGEETSVDVLAFVVGAIRGTVRDPDGRTVDDAWVRAGSDAHSGGVDTVTNDDGTFEIADVPFGVDLTLTAGAPEWADAEPVNGVRPDGDPPVAVRDLTLRRHASLVIRVLDTEGRPADARVTIDGSTNMVRERGTGEFARERIAPGAHTVAAKPANLPEVRQTVTLAAGETTDVALRLIKGEAIEGVVVDANGAPVGDATVIAGPAAEAEPASLVLRAARISSRSEVSTQSADDGSFRLEHLAAGDYALSAAGDLCASASFVAAHAPSSGNRIQVSPTSRITFRVVGSDTTVKGIGVSACAPGAPPNRSAGGAAFIPRYTTEEGGVRLQISGLLHEVRALSICGETFAPVVVAVTPVAGAATDLGDIHVDAGLPLKGRVVATDGKPVAGVQVAARLSAAGWRWCKSADDGTFALEHLAPGPVVLRAAADGLLGVAVLDVRRDAPPADVVVHALGVVHGTVRNADGTPAVGARVTVRHAFADASDDAFEASGAMSSAEGRFNAVVAAGRCLASAGGAWVRADVAEGGEATVTLEKP
jgi:hypothetical protein